MNKTPWSLSSVLLLGLAGCQGTDPVDPKAGDDGINPWAGTSWPVLFQEARELGGRAMIVPSGADSGFDILPIDPRPRVVWIDPACSVPGDPGVAEARAFLDCVEELARETEMSIPTFGREYAFRIRPNRLLTWEVDAGDWRVWHYPKFTCGEGWNAARHDRVVRDR